jgi:hypothetical protein
MTGRNPRSGFVSRPSDPDTWVGAPEPNAPRNGARADLTTARLTLDVTPEPPGRIMMAAFQRGVTVAEMLRDLLTCKFPHSTGGIA